MLVIAIFRLLGALRLDPFVMAVIILNAVMIGMSYDVKPDSRARLEGLTEGEGLNSKTHTHTHTLL